MTFISIDSLSIFDESNKEIIDCFSEVCTHLPHPHFTLKSELEIFIARLIE